MSLKPFTLSLACTLAATWLSAGEPYEKFQMPPFMVGTCTHIPSHKRGLAESNLNMIKEAGIMSTRDESPWYLCEPKKGELKVPADYLKYIDQARSRGLSPLNLLVYGNHLYDEGCYPHSTEAVEAFTRYSETMATALKGKVRMHQVWNEWDGSCGMSPKFKGKNPPDQYVRLLENVYPRLKKIDPTAVVISTSVCSGDAWFEKMLQAGAMKSCDVLALHTYNYGDGTPETWYERMIKIRTMIRQYNNGKDFPLYITEMGYPTQLDARGTSPELSAAYMARIYLLAKTFDFIKGLWWYDFQDDGWKSTYNEDNFGIVKADLTAKPAYYVMRDLAPLIKNGVFVKRLPTPDPQIWVLQFKLPDGKDTLALWSAYADDDWQICLRRNNGNSVPIQVHHAGRQPYSQPWGARDWVNNRTVATRSDELEFCLRAMPLLLEGDLNNVSVVSVKKRPFQELRRIGPGACQLPRGYAEATKVGTPTKVYQFGLDRNYEKLMGIARKDKKDLDASFSVQYDSEKLYLQVTVQDDVFFQNWKIEDAWQGDGLQLAFQAPDYEADFSAHTDLDAALTPEGPRLLLRQAQNGKGNRLLAPQNLSIERKNNTTVYRLAVSWQDLGLPVMDHGAVMKFSLLVNDNDGNGRKGYLHWGDGIGKGKNPEAYYMLLLN